MYLIYVFIYLIFSYLQKYIFARVGNCSTINVDNLFLYIYIRVYYMYIY